ncbi:MAG: 50S ribosomal protein L29 [bacterium]|nr:50S ribosomal protein L29 [bacterium]
MKAIELRQFSYGELGGKLDEAKEELFNLRFQLATNQLDNSTRLREVRREIARINTIRREQELEAYYREQQGSQES